MIGQLSCYCGSKKLDELKLETEEHPYTLLPISIKHHKSIKYWGLVRDIHLGTIFLNSRKRATTKNNLVRYRLKVLNIYIKKKKKL